MDLSKRMCLEDIQGQLAGKQVVVRVDYNVPQNADGSVANTQRIEASLPTLDFLFKAGATRVVLLSHLGRPDGAANPKYSLKPVADALGKLQSRPVQFFPDCIGQEAAVAATPSGTLCLMENVRFYKEEEGKGASSEQVATFRAGLSKLGDLYVNDAFGCAHRAHSSVVGIDCQVRACGALMQKELGAFSKVIESPERPLCAILGGSKVSDKLALITSLLEKVNSMVIVGGMAFPFVKADGGEVGKSLCEPGVENHVAEIRRVAKERGVDILLPTDFVCGTSLDDESPTTHAAVPADRMGLDVGPQSLVHFGPTLAGAKTIIWNGPPGVFEKTPYIAGSKGLCDLVCKSGATKIVGGGDTATLVKKLGRIADFDHVSTGGGASLELLEGKILPGVDIISKK